jgi:hypothetical protein
VCAEKKGGHSLEYRYVMEVTWSHDALEAAKAGECRENLEHQLRSDRLENIPQCSLEYNGETVPIGLYVISVDFGLSTSTTQVSGFFFF